MVKRRNLLFLIRSLDIGGAQRQLVTLAKAIDKSLFDVSVLCFYGGGSLETELQGTDIVVIPLNKNGRWDVLKFGYKLLKCSLKLRPDILHSYLGVSNILAVLLKPFQASTKIVWGGRASHLDLSGSGTLARITFMAEQCLSRFANLIIVNSHAGFEYYAERGFPTNKIIVIPNGIDTAKFRPDRKGGVRMRMIWDIPIDAIVIGIVGRLDPVKDHYTLLHAAALFSRQEPRVRFVCAGPGRDDDVEKLCLLAKRLGVANRFVWATAQYDMPAVYNALDILTLSSTGEGFPNSVGEAMACAVPCVVTDVGDSSIIVGETGVVVTASNPQALSSGWDLCIQMDTKKLGARARRRVEEHFSIERLVNLTQEAFSALN